METTVTGLFHDAETAQRARRELEREGFAAAAIEVLSKDSENLHAALDRDTSDGVRGMWWGAIVSGIGHAVGAIVISLPPIELVQVHWAIAAVVGAVIGAVSGAPLGYFIGSVTGGQVTQEYEAEIARGGELLAVNTDGANAPKAQAVLEHLGASQVSTAVHPANGSPSGEPWSNGAPNSA